MHHINFMRSEVLTVVMENIRAFWDITPTDIA
jgi:hypothetical protein